MSRLLATFRKDMKMSFRSFYIYIEIVMALIIVAVLLFVVPESFSPQQHLHVYLDVETAFEEMLLDQLQTEEEQALVLHQVDSREALMAAVEADRSTSGLIIRLESGHPTFEFVLQGYESDQVRNLLEKTFLADSLRQLPDFESKTTITVLDETAEKLSDRLNILPVFLVLNSALIGLFIIAAYIYIDKDEGTIRAYAVTPATTWQYLLGKMGMMLVTGLVTGLLSVLAVAGRQVHVLHFVAILTACNIFGSSLGLLIASFFNTMTKSLGALYIVVMIMALASVSYMMPAFSPLLIRLLPAYPMLYAFRQTLLSQPDTGYIYTWSAVFIVSGALLFWLANLRYKRTLTI